MLAGTRNQPASDTPKWESHEQATDQRNDRHTIHGQDLAGAQRQNVVGSSETDAIRWRILASRS